MNKEQIFELFLDIAAPNVDHRQAKALIDAAWAGGEEEAIKQHQQWVREQLKRLEGV